MQRLSTRCTRPEFEYLAKNQKDNLCNGSKSVEGEEFARSQVGNLNFGGGNYARKSHIFTCCYHNRKNRAKRVKKINNFPKF